MSGRNRAEQGTDMVVYNTAVPVVANVMAENPAEAVARLANALRAAGFEPLEDPAAMQSPFEAEAGTPADL